MKVALFIAIFCAILFASVLATAVDPVRYESLYPNIQFWRQFSGPRYGGGGAGRMRLMGIGLARMIDE